MTNLVSVPSCVMQGENATVFFQVYVYRQIISSTRTELFSLKLYLFIDLFLAVPGLLAAGAVL